MTENLIRSGRPTLLVTGASGFVGRHFIDMVKDRCFIHAVARRSQADAGVPSSPSVIWTRADIGEQKSIDRAMDSIVREGGVDFIVHCAGYYDYTDRNTPEYQRTNVQGTRFLLAHAQRLGAKRFIYASSLAVSGFSKDDRVITEESLPDATIPYALSKRAAEELVRQASTRFPCTIVRLAAIFSDWCEYGPLYALLEGWLNSRLPAILVGKGNSALPYLHVGDLCRLFWRIIERHEALSSLDVFLASQDGAVSHRDLYEIVSRYGGSTRRQAVFMPRWLAAFGVAARRVLGLLTGNEPFERLWMLRYIDMRLVADVRKTRKLLDWQPPERYQVRRRLLFMIENMKTNPSLWRQKNQVMAHKSVEAQPGLVIYEVMLARKQEVVTELVDYLHSPENCARFPSYQALDPATLHLRVSYLYDLFELVFLSGDRRHMLCYAGYLARQRSNEGFSLEELRAALDHTVAVTEQILERDRALAGYAGHVKREIAMTIQMMVDEIEEVYHHLEETGAGDKRESTSCEPDMWYI